MRKLLFIITFCFALCSYANNEYKIVSDIPYASDTETDAYARQRCTLDVYFPTNKTNCPVIVWFHGGGLEGGEKYFPKQLMNEGVVIVAVNYRLSPKASRPAYIQDAAASVSWALKNIKRYNGNPDYIYVSGHSAGGYLSLMLALDKSYLAKYDIDADSIKSYFPISGQTITHTAIRKELKLNHLIPYIDEYAPLHHIRKTTAPIFLFTGDAPLEIASRYEENAYLLSSLKSIGNTVTTLYRLEGFNHGTVVAPACSYIIDEIHRQTRK